MSECRKKTQLGESVWQEVQSEPEASSGLTRVVSCPVTGSGIRCGKILVTAD